MQVTRRSPLTGNLYTMNLPITLDQIAAYERGDLLEEAFPQLTAEQHEFIYSGLTPEEQKKTQAPHRAQLPLHQV